MLPREAIGAVPGAVVDQVIADKQILVMRQDQSFIGRIPQMPFDPEELVLPRRRVPPGRGGQNIGIEPLRQQDKGFNRSGQGIHEGEDPRYFVFSSPIHGEDIIRGFRKP